MNSVRRIPVRHVGVPLTEVVQVLGIEEPAQPQKVAGGQFVVRDDIDRNFWHALRSLQRGDRRDLLGYEVLRKVQLVARLQVEPKLRRDTEESLQTKCRVSRDPALTVHDLVDTARRHSDRHRELVLRDLKPFMKSSMRTWPG